MLLGVISLLSACPGKKQLVIPYAASISSIFAATLSYVICAVAAGGLAIGLFFGIWRIFFRANWYYWRSRTSIRRRAKRHIAHLASEQHYFPSLLNPGLKLGLYGNDWEAAVPILIKGLTKALKDKHPNVRFKSAIALGNIGPDAKDAVPALIKAIRDEYAHVRETTAEALIKIGDRSTIPTLKGLLNDKDEVVRKVAKGILEKIQAGRKQQN